MKGGGRAVDWGRRRRVREGRKTGLEGKEKGRRLRKKGKGERLGQEKEGKGKGNDEG